MRRRRMTSQGTAAVKRPKVGVGVMIVRDGKILLGQRKGAHGESTYGWCGGHVEHGETLEEAAKREVFEETGIEVRSLDFLCVSNIIEYGKHYLDIEFQCSDFEGEPRVLEPDRVVAWEWYDPDNLPQHLFAAVALAISSHKSHRFYNP
jgi:8-oxo-dGTP diphosphatase